MDGVDYTVVFSCTYVRKVKTTSGAIQPVWKERDWQEVGAKKSMLTMIDQVLTLLKAQKDRNHLVTRCPQELRQYDFIVWYRKGVNASNVDAPPRTQNPTKTSGVVVLALF